MLPNYLVIGAARCGTSWLARNLMCHPNVYMPAQKELHFFDRNYQNGIAWYEAFFRDRNEQAIGEATPAYLYFEQIPELIYRYMPGVRLIVLLRDPIERAYSHYWNIRAKAGKGDDNYAISFEDKLRRTPRLIDEGMYAQSLKRYLRLFRREQLLVLLYDDLKRDPKGLLRAVYDHVGVQTWYEEQLVEQTVNGSASKVGRSLLAYGFYRGVLRIGLYGMAKRIDCWNRGTVQEMNPSTRTMLLEKHYLAEIQELQDMLGRDLTEWTKA